MYRAGRELSGPAEAEFWALMDRFAGRVNRVTWKNELRLMMRAGEFEKAYLFALQHDHELRIDEVQLAQAELEKQGWKKEG